jgi:hypothetical protein
MDNVEQDVKVLRKVLNGPLFLDKYPLISRVWVEEYGTNRIDIILNVKDPYSEYTPLRDEIKSYIYNLAKMLGVKSRFIIYP